MVDSISTNRRSENMRRIRAKDMKPEILVRKLIHNMGYRYRLHRKDLPGKPDLVFPSRKKVIFVHGCFWHQHNSPTCKISRIPKSNQGYWIPKLNKNKKRDAQQIQALETSGWKVLVIWECEIKNFEAVSSKASSFLDA